MFAIDLLKGNGLPKTLSLRQKITRAICLVLPLTALIILAGAWCCDNRQLKSQIKAIEENEAIARMYNDKTADYQKATDHTSDLKKKLAAATNTLSSRVQVSELFRELTGKLPAELFLYEIKLDRVASSEKFQAEDSKEIKYRTIINRSLTLVLCDFNTSNGDMLVEEYMAGLKQSPIVSSLFKEIKPAARQQGTVGEQNATYYYIECDLVEQKQ